MRLISANIIRVLFFSLFVFLSSFNTVHATVGASCENDTDCSPTETCHCSDGQACTGGQCVAADYSSICAADGREYCVNSGGTGRHTCCSAGYKCGTGGNGCVPAGPTGGSCGDPEVWNKNCPPGTVRGTALVSSGCYRPSYCPGMGTAQKSGACCEWTKDAPQCREVCQNGKCWDVCEPNPRSCVYYALETYNCVPVATPTPVPATPTPTPMPTAQCINTKIYTNTWVELTPEAFKGLSSGIQVYYCVNGVTNSNVFDAGRFTINGVLRPQTTLKRPNSNDFCDLYTIPANTYTFKIQGELHHSSLGWL